MTLDADLAARFGEGIDSPDTAERLDAVSALGRLGVGGEAEAILTRVAADDDVQSVRRAAERAREALTRRLAVSAYDEPVPAWIDSAEPARRFAVFDALGPSALDPRSVALVAASDPEPWVRSAALRALGKSECPASLDLLRSALTDEKESGLVRGAALEALGVREAASAVTWARELVASPEGPLRRAAVRVLAGADTGWLLEKLDGMLRGLDRRARASAVWSLSLVEDSRVEDITIHALAQENDRELMEQEAALLLSRQSRAALGMAGVLRRSLDERVAAVASTLYDQLLSVHQPSRQELAALEEAYLEERRRRTAPPVPSSSSSSFSSSSSSIQIPIVRHGPRPSRTGLFLFLALAAFVAVVALGRVLDTASVPPPGVLSTAEPGPAVPSSASAVVLGPGGTFGGRAVVTGLRAEHGEIELRCGSGLVLRLRLQEGVPPWVCEGARVLVAATGGQSLGPSGVLYFERGSVEPAP